MWSVEREVSVFSSTRFIQICYAHVSPKVNPEVGRQGDFGFRILDFGPASRGFLILEFRLRSASARRASLRSELRRGRGSSLTPGEGAFEGWGHDFERLNFERLNFERLNFERLNFERLNFEL